MKTAFYAIYFAVSVALLMITFRIVEYSSNTTLSKPRTIVSYVILGLLLSVIAAYLAPWIIHLLFPKLRDWAEAITTSGIIFLLLCCISVFFGPFGVDIPGTRIRGIFFSEFKFVNFIVYDGIFLAVLGGLLRRFVKR